MKTKESILHEQVCDYLKLQYPNVLFRSDFAAGEKLSMSQAVRNKRLQKCRAWPDIMISEPKYQRWAKEEGHSEGLEYFGLFIELKAGGTKLKTKLGNWATPHLCEQAEVLQELEQRGYKAVFGVGFEHTKQILDDYLGGS